MTEPASAAGNRAPLAAYAERIAPSNLVPLWDRLHDLITPHPAGAARPALWAYDTVRPLLLEAGGLITAHGRRSGGCWSWRIPASPV